MASDIVKQQRARNCVFLEIVQPKEGPLTRARLLGELGDLCAEITWDEHLRVAVLSFPGAALRSLEPAPELLLGSLPSFVECVANLKLPVIAAIDGDAVGPGLELALACDVRIGTAGARFGLPQVQSGSIPHDGGTQRLRRYVGLGKALEMVLLGETIDAAEAGRVGLLNRVVDPAELSSVAEAMAFDMAARSPLSMSYVKEALHKGLDLTLSQGIQMELDMYLHLFTSEDRTEGITAFKEKRVARFEGR